jgi:hypothetical protein
MSAQAQDNSEFLSAVEHILSLTTAAGDGAIVAHDPSDPRHVAYFEHHAARAGLTADRYPALYESFRSLAPREPAPGPIANAGDYTGAFTDNQKVDYISKNQPGNTTGHATFTRTKPVSSMFVVLSVVNVTNGVTTVVASGNTTAFNQQTVELVTNDNTAQPYPTTGRTSGVISWSVRYTDGTTDANHTQSQWGYQTASDPVVTNPVINPNRHQGDMNNIVVGLSRGFNSPANNTDVDYWFWQTQWQNTTLLMPLSGSMTFLYPIAPLGPTNPILEFYLARTEGGMSDLKVQDTTPYLQYFTIDPQNPAKLNFSLLAGPNSQGGAINFGLSPWVSNTQTFFTTRVTVTFQNPIYGQGWSSIISSPTQNNDPTDGVTYIKPVMYLWHCLAAGTMIYMADGSSQAVETLNSGNVVNSGSGITRNVMGTLAQPHWGTVYNITCSRGFTITCSGTHPFITPTGPVQAASLTVGATVLTTQGSATITSITTSTYNNQGLFNLWLDPTVPGYTSFYANNYLVGDYQMQVALLPADAQDPALRRAKLPSDLYTDFDSYIADRAARATVRG